MILNTNSAQNIDVNDFLENGFLTLAHKQNGPSLSEASILLGRPLTDYSDFLTVTEMNLFADYFEFPFDATARFISILQCSKGGRFVKFHDFDFCDWDVASKNRTKKNLLTAIKGFDAIYKMAKTRFPSLYEVGGALYKDKFEGNGKPYLLDITKDECDVIEYDIEIILPVSMFDGFESREDIQNFLLSAS
ncbi:hypothetical protein ACTFQF_00210 [Aliivibrio fischeri]|uniref:Uncharacterized protein n=1 Tax=Aliivibrio fischeri (strain MJ11) TaxID=388396 RepID=B5EW21_ALIFM|nr:hypothetical protein [Aliivibrio fischeri]ACH64771.1 hypothetical protein VFMJ11_B0078 [Aliivibrio fischeri MJ11]MUK37479.1 hypothetical protein [Aliivibrio fischeri]